MASYNFTLEVLRELGHDAFATQPSLAVPGGAQEPDYVFYWDAAARDADKGMTLDEERLSGRAYAVGDAKRWDRPLDVALKEGKRVFDNQNPSYQISFYMQHAGMEWGILTNGRLWRLYHRSNAYKLDRFYEVDLPALLEAGDPEAFAYFFAFFRRESFEDLPLGIAEILRAGTDYARGIEDTLKAQVYEALRHLAQGFLDYPPNGLGPDPATLKEIYDNSLIVLYRLLFILYGESRGLLPLRESLGYRQNYSLDAIKHAVAEDLDAGRVLLTDSDILWPRLKALFRIIDRGNAPLSVATFNGGLFDPRLHPFVEENTVGDAHLQQAIDNLARVDGRFVDYRDLAERHLGTIYEGLLEFHLEALSEPQEAWTVELLNDRGERRATGSYYTPDHIVKYIVDQCVGPALQRAVEDAEEVDGEGTAVEAVLALNVIDPAMGSGHFLVEATEYIARFLVGLGAGQDRAADAAGEGAGGYGDEAELAYWKRRVVQSCIYGVDLNPLAVELAKLSLWLATAAKDRPLSFLDHHLRCGNSLIGEELGTLHVYGGGKLASKA